MSQLAAVVVIQEGTHIVDIAIFALADAAEFTRFYTGNDILGLADPLGYQMRRANYYGRIRVQQLDNPQADSRLVMVRTRRTF